jgi:F0F1-type ATP synthase membrane subunit b/b'
MELTPRQQEISNRIADAKQHYEDGLITEIEMKRKIAEIKRQAFHSFGTD